MRRPAAVVFAALNQWFRLREVQRDMEELRAALTERANVSSARRYHMRVTFFEGVITGTLRVSRK